MVLFIMVFIAATGTLSARGLYADGPFWLYHMLLRGGFYIFDSQRAYAQFVVELPVYLAIEAGVRDLNALIRIHSFGLIGLPILFWCGALLIQLRTSIFWWLTLVFAVTYLRSGFFAAGEYNTAYSLVALSFSIILLKKISHFYQIILICCAIVLTHAYESMLFIGVFLALTCLVRIWLEKSDGRILNLILLISCTLFLYAAFVGVRSTFFYRHEDLQATINYHALFEPHVSYLLWMIASAMLMVLAPLSSWLKNVVAGLALLASLIYLVFLWRWDKSGISYGFYSYAYRSLGAFMLAGILFCVWLINVAPSIFRHQVFKLNEPLLACIVSLVFLVQACMLLGHSFGYYRWLKAFEKEALLTEGLVPIDQTEFNKGFGSVSGYNWPWSNATLSVLLRGNAEAIITNASNFDGWETFDPKTIEKYPFKDFSKSAPLRP
jgi:hypothetical protein